MKRFSMLLIILLVVTGCATTNNAITTSPLSGRVWEGTVVAKPYSVARTKTVSDINDHINKVDDEYSRTFVTNEINKEVPLSESIVSFYDNISCQRKIDYLLKNIDPIIKNMSSSVSYVANFPVGVGAWEKRPFSTYNSVTTTKMGNDSYQQQLSSDMKWRNDTKREATGYAKIKVISKINCEDKNNTAYFKISIPDYIVQNPEVGFGQNSAVLSIDWGKIEKSFDSINKEYEFNGEQEYSTFLQKVAQRINYQLKNRFSTLSRETSKNEEHVYKIAIDVISSRIQRKLESYKFNTDRTRYEFSDNVAYHGINVSPKTVVKIFPEENGKSSIVFSVEYTPIRDNIAGTMTFGEDDARKYLRGQIDNFERLIVAR